MVYVKDTDRHGNSLADRQVELARFERDLAAQERETAFGPARMAGYDTEELPNDDQITDFIWLAEEAAAFRSQGYHAIHSTYYHGNRKNIIRDRVNRSLGVQWNIPGLYGGLGADRLDGSLVRISNIDLQLEQDDDENWHLLAREGLFIPHANFVPRVDRTVVQADGEVVRATKWANVTELQRASKLIEQYVELDMVTNPISPSDIPLYVEVGYGLDPMAERGQRKFPKGRRRYIGFETAEGEYDNDIGEYSDAVRLQTERHGKKAAEERPGEDIQYRLETIEGLDLPDKAVSEMFASNIFNAPIPEENKLRMLRKLRPIIKPFGQFVCRVNWHTDQWPASKMSRLLRDNGYSIINVIDSTENPYFWLDEQYGRTERESPYGYYILAHPNS